MKENSVVLFADCKDGLHATVLQVKCSSLIWSTVCNEIYDARIDGDELFLTVNHLVWNATYSFRLLCSLDDNKLECYSFDQLDLSRCSFV